MFNPTYLCRSRHAVYYLRWRFVAPSKGSGRWSTIKLSLGTRDPKVALMLVQSLTQHANELAEWGASRGMRYVEIRDALRQHFERRLAILKKRIEDTGRLQPSYLAGLAETAMWSDQAVKAGLVQSEVEPPEQLPRLIAKLQLPIEADTADYRSFGTEYQRAMRDFALAAIALDKGLETFNFGAGHDVVPILPTKLSVASVALVEVVRRYTAEGLLIEKWAAKTKSEKEEHFALLYELVGSGHDFKLLDRQAAQSVKQALLNYPKNRRKNPLTRGLSLDDAMALGGVEKLHPQTINKYLQSYTALFAWAKDNGYASENVFAGMTIARKKGNSAQRRDPFSDVQIKTMVAELSANASGYVSRDYQKWGGLIGIYTGARLNEISQLLLSDIHEKEGILCFDFNDDDEGKHIKTESSKRLVPMHSSLIKMGLPLYISQLREAGQQRLFPSFRYEPQNGWGRPLGRWFNDRFLPKLEFKSKTLVFHSLRHTVVTRLLQLGTEQPVVRAIVGHAQEGVTQQSYFKQGYKLSQLSEAIELLV